MPSSSTRKTRQSVTRSVREWDDWREYWRGSAPRGKRALLPSSGDFVERLLVVSRTSADDFRAHVVLGVGIKLQCIVPLKSRRPRVQQLRFAHRGRARGKWQRANEHCDNCG